MRSQLLSALRAAFPHTIPIMAAFICLGMALGILLQSKGYSFLWALLISGTIYAGSMEFIAVDLLASAFALLNAFFLTIMVNGRHLFYGFSLLDKFNHMGLAKGYLIFALSDETFALLSALEPPPAINRKYFFVMIALLNQLYWVCGAVMGALIGSGINFNLKGMGFVLTALFVAILVDMLNRARHNRLPGLIGVLSTLACLFVFKAEHFLLPSMIALIALLTILRKPLGKVTGRP